MTGDVAVTPVPGCVVCGADGRVLHERARDRVFGAPGEWRYRRCTRCRLVWQDPMVTEADVGRLYETYYTHAQPAADGTSLPRRLYRSAQRGYIAVRYGYPVATWTERALGCLLALHPGRRADAEFLAQYLPAADRGRLLDVGCGHGAMLAQMRDLGWTVEGVEPDVHAVATASARGFRVAHGTVFSAGLEPGAYDAITMSHVMEHVHRPIDTLRRCLDLLAPGGTLVAITPNADSWGHQRFGVAWRGLEPPRHLQVFTRPALAMAAREAGFAAPRVRVTIRNARGIYDASLSIERAIAQGPEAQAEIPLPGIRSELWQAAEWCRTFVRPDAGEELVLIARRD
ncbi:MAG: class I SAM-dependent methyltransferase [Vicinamibacterales bacterium]